MNEYTVLVRVYPKQSGSIDSEPDEISSNE